MDSPLINRIFRRLLSHETCSKVRHATSIPPKRQLIAHGPYRTFLGVTKPTKGRYGNKERDKAVWRQRVELEQDDKRDEFKEFPFVTADQLRGSKKRPRRVKMLLRDFIEDSLYNPNYGYFPKQAVIFSPGEPFDFPNIRDEPEFFKLLGRRYTEFEDALDEKEYSESRQLWHTPTELFEPFYGEAMARYMVTNYKLSLYPYYDLLIYEMGAGNGTLMLNILDHIRGEHPEVYERTKFRVVEISSSLAALQIQKLKQDTRARGHLDKVEIINRSIFDWDTYVSSPCFFLALEVFDNFAHDAIRYNTYTGKPLQAAVLIDGAGEFYEFYERDIDPVASRFLKIRDIATRSSYNHPLGGASSILWRNIRQRFPGAEDLTKPEYIPTRLMQFFDILHHYFPAHRLLSSDFHFLPNAVAGINAPVVQTRFGRRTIAVTTPLVLQGYFDILFPTDFRVMEDVYRAITGKLTRVSMHEDFLKRWAYIEDTQTQSGENPLLNWYKNASVMITV